MKLFDYIRRLWRGIRRRHRIDRVVYVESMSELPKKLKGDLYIVGGTKPKWAVLACPCKCGDRIDVNLMERHHPSWRLQTDRGKVTLHPSLWMPEDKCGSHFWIKRNTVEWVPDI
jgi:hypothetical protein